MRGGLLNNHAQKPARKMRNNGDSMSFVSRSTVENKKKTSPSLKIVEALTVIEAWSDGLGLIVAERIEDGRAAQEATGLETWIVSSTVDMPELADRVSRHIEVVTIITSASKEGAAAARELARRLEARGIEARIIARGV
jgi:hypothetical protein